MKKNCRMFRKSPKQEIVDYYEIKLNIQSRFVADCIRQVFAHAEAIWVDSVPGSCSENVLNSQICIAKQNEKSFDEALGWRENLKPIEWKNERCKYVDSNIVCHNLIIV